MELRVESTEGYSLPSGCHVGVRVGDVLKQGRYEPQRCYHFPQVDRRRNAKIDLYQHVGSCVVTVDPATKSNHEVAVTTTDPSFPATKLKVSVQSKSEEAGKQHREERTKTLKNQAKDYLAKHCVEERLSEAVKALLKEQPADPTEFLCRFFREDQSHLLKPAETPQNQKTQAATAAAKPQEVAPAAPPAATKSSAPVRKPAPAKPTVAAEQATDNGELERALLAAKQDMETNQEARFDRPLEEERSTHLMHNMAMCGPAFSSFGMQPGLVFI
mmetsp:Transcript_51671/g.92801  ORF Transcript_51671/g.92801 Transcript_51671/m.92801 type:complete len:273 (-) Transcript_51671:254-1072(-)|eukprot:CAMPEP_0197708752 /NCGR_PEP_ID=MMETSP1338-20131121/128114_1 /TAXON_ID=43686 ORGANISM="Pelagodinium beii, Strain RCC1491" /NCGR_SAMPLE_ID=MMETSP1338 /ASSEMBLY_ACC=CAM_ASM_000754 /LENGTH=272 /DNA_ID=CAMNT_0043292683 /DNA_START=96 /DNA_END=914 /DNA_ORIENTATION=+